MPYILIVDDDEDFSGAIARVLKNAGYEVALLHETRPVAASIAERQPDLLVLDVMFPEDSTAGFDLAREIRKNKQIKPALPILMLTAVNEKFPLGFSADDIDADWLPVTEFIEKPVDFDVLLGKIREIVG